MLIANRYEPTGAMAWGGMAEVHTCEDHHLKRHVVLKRVKKPEDYNRLQDELKSLLKVRSPHVVELLDIVEYDYKGELEKGLILEFINGSDLSEGSFTYGPQYLKALWQIASGIADIHDRDIIHRDIKPANVRQDSNGVLKIIDFGLSREKDVDDKTKSVIGSFGYIAPELTTIGEKAVAKSADVYAYGATAVSLLVPVVQQQGPLSKKMVGDVLAGADQDLQDILAKCVSKNPSDRPDISDVRDMLHRKLLRDRRRGWINVNGKITEVSAASNVGTIKSGNSQIQIEYNGYDFVVKSVSGAITINNSPVAAGLLLNSSCLITFGMTGGTRAFVTFDVSSPEVSV
jgi:serine/threonine protein kinase